jgi:hypothetical protein
MIRRWYLVLIGAIILSGGVMLIVTSSMKSCDAYREALVRARGNSALVAALGEPINDGFLPTGSIKISGDSGVAQLSISISGPKGSGVLYLDAKKSMGKWSFDLLKAVIDGTEQEIDLLVAVFANPQKDDEVASRWKKVNSVAVYFNPKPDGQKWVGKKLSDVAPVANVSKLILLEAMTSAPLEIDTLNVFKTLETDLTFYHRDGKYPDLNITWRAIIVLKDHQVFQLEIGRDPDRKGISRLISEKGYYGYLK